MSVLTPVDGAADLEEARALFEEYARELPPGHLCVQGFAEELAGLPGAYAPPRGRLLLARVDGAPAGCVAVRPVNADVGELKRMYVRPPHRGRGLGRELLAAAIAEARQAGYRWLCLDTLPTMTAAQALYRTFGFQPAERYLPVHVEGAVCLALALG
jgi:GNAT superfamily N-acetyltransferase